MVYVFKRELVNGVTASGVFADGGSCGVDVLDGFTDNEVIASRYCEQLENVKIMQNPTPSDTIRIYKLDGSILENRDRLTEMNMIPEKQIFLRTSSDGMFKIYITEYAIQFVTSVIPPDGQLFNNILCTMLENVLWLYKLFDNIEFNFEEMDAIETAIVNIGMKAIKMLRGFDNIDQIRTCNFMLFLDTRG